MRLILALWVLIALASCQAEKPSAAAFENINEQMLYPMQMAPTLQLGQRVFECDSALEIRDRQMTALRDSVNGIVRSVCKEDSLRRALFIANYKIEGVKKYLRICDNNPSQVKFLRGWVRRAIE